MSSAWSGLWARVSEPKNLAVIVALGGALGFVWTQVIDPHLNPKPAAEAPVSQQATASGGGQAINAEGSSIVVTGGPIASGVVLTPAAASAAHGAASQSATATEGGTAINAAGQAQVNVNSKAH